MNLIALPKIELHCHLDGSVRPETILELAQQENIPLTTYDIEELRNMLIAPWECNSLDEYLQRFTLPIAVMQSKKNLRRIAYELMEDSAKENIKYIEVRFAPILHIEKGLEVEEIIESVLDGIKEGEERFNIKGNLILSCMRNMSDVVAFHIVEKGKKFLGKGVVAIDLCSVESEGFSEKFAKPIALARKYGYRVTIHAGETGIGKNVLEAIEILHAERIGHGVFIKDYPLAYNVVKQKGITLEMCPTSNIQTKAVANFKEHPIYGFLKDGIKVTVNTDNRTVSNTTLGRECEVLFNELNIYYEDYKQIYFNSIDAAFTDLETKEKLRTYILDYQM